LVFRAIVQDSVDIEPLPGEPLKDTHAAETGQTTPNGMERTASTM
jgi:hypothetical protein